MDQEKQAQQLASGEENKAVDFYNSGNKNITQDSNKPQKDNKTGPILTEVQVRTIDRSPKDILTWRSGIISAESIYFPNHQRLYDLYSDIQLDGHLAGIIDKRIDTVLNKDLYYEIPTQEGYEKLDDMDALIESDMFRSMMYEILMTRMWGRSGFEFIPGKDFCWLPIPRKHIKMKTQKITFQQTGLTDGIDYTEYANIWVIGKSQDLGLLASCAQYALYKRGNMADWANYIELFGMPGWLFQYEAYDEQTKAAIKDIIDNVGSMLRVMVPDTVKVQPMEAKSSNGTGGLQEAFYKACNDEMSVRILGATETTGSNKGSGYAQSKTHSEQQLEITKSDIAYLRNHLNSSHFINILKSYGYPVETGRFTFNKEADIRFLSQKIIIDQALISAGLPVGYDYLYENYAIPAPKPDEQIVVPIKAPMPQNEDNDPENDDDDQEQEQKPKGKNLKAQFAQFLKGKRFFD